MIWLIISIAFNISFLFLFFMEIRKNKTLNDILNIKENIIVNCERMLDVSKAELKVAHDYNDKLHAIVKMMFREIGKVKNESN